MKRTLTKRMSRAAVFAFLLASLFASLFLGVTTGCRVASAAASTVKIYIGDSKTARHHMAITQGELSDEYSFSVKDHEVKSSSYVSSNPASFQITAAGSGTCKVKAVAEGTGFVTLTVKTTDGQTLTEKVFVSVYKKVTACQAEAVKKTDVYRGASSNSGVENEDKKGTLSKGEAVTVIATCGNYYLFRAKSGITYEDDKDTGFVKKSDIKIPVEKVSIQEKNISVEKGKTAKLNVTVSPGLADEKTVTWKTGNSKTASVNAAGTISAKAEGTTTVSATAKDGSGKSDSIYLSVYQKVTETSGYLKADTDFYAVGNDKVSIGKGKRGTALTIVGTCKSYYRVKTAESLVSAAYGGLSYVPKTKVAIPVVGVTLNKKKATIQAGKKLPLTATVSPSMADNKKVTWKSSNKKIVSVNSKGEVTAKKAGWAVITVTSVDGKKSGSCEVFVSETKYANKKVQSRTSLTVDPDSMSVVNVEAGNTEPHTGFQLYVNGKKYHEYTYKKMRGETDRWLTGLRVNKTYKIQVRTFIKKGNKRVYHKMSKAQKITAGKITISANALKDKSLTIHWEKIGGVRKYEVYRAGKKNGKYKLLKGVKKNKNSYTDKSVKVNKTYYYKVKPVNKEGKKGSSNIDYATACKLKNAAKYITKKYDIVYVGKKKSIHSYNKNGIYSPVKYRMNGNTLEIHVYLEFVTYHDTGKKDVDEEKIYKKGVASVQSEVSTANYISWFKKGIERAYTVNVIGGKGDFKEGVNFSTRMIIHSKWNGEKYKAKQNFIEVQIGGECPNCVDGEKRWYHSHLN